MNEQALLNKVLKGDEEAINLMNDLAMVSQVWDDLIDRDKPVDNRMINEAFLALLYCLPRNDFYTQNITELQPVIDSAMIDWFTANELEQCKGSEIWDSHEKPMAWCLRDSLASVLICCAKIIGGMDWAISVSLEIRRFVHDEAIEDYMT